MSQIRRAKRTDGNQAEVVKELRKIPGVAVALDHDDILIGYRGKTYWIEIKDPAKTLNKNGTVKKGKHIKDSQVQLLQNWTGHYSICWSLDDILDELGVKKSPQKRCGHCWLHSEIDNPKCECEK